MLATLIFSALALAVPPTSDRLEIKDVIGSPEIKVLHTRSKNNKESTVTKGEMVFLGDEIQTEARQVVHIQAFDGSEWKIGQNTRLKLEKRPVEQKKISYWIFDLVQGAFWGKVTHEEESDGYRQKVKSKSAAMGIRGTEYLMLATENSSEVDVLDGVVFWGKSEDFAPGTYVEVKKGEHADLKDGVLGKPSLNTLASPELMKKYQLAWEGVAQDAAAAKPGIDNCRRQGKGWKNVEGDRYGKCK